MSDFIYLINEYLSKILSLANGAIFLLVVVIVGHGLYDNSIPTDRGILVIAGAVVICGLVATLMEIKLSLSNISDSAYNTKEISLATHNLLKKEGDDK